VIKITSYRGYKTVVVYDEETSYGAGSTPATVIKGKLSTFSINKNNTLIRTVGLGEGRNETFVALGNFEGSWSAEYELAAFDFLQYGIGAMAGTGTAIDPYYLEEKDYIDYTAGADSGMKSFGLTVNSLDPTTSDNELLSGCIINTIGLTLALGSTLKCSVEGFYKTVTNSTDTTAYTSDTTKPWIFAQGAFNWNGNNVARVTSAAITINNNFDAEVGRELGSRFVEAAEPGLRKYDWTVTLKMTDTIATTIRSAFYGDAVSSPNSPAAGHASAEPDFYELILDLSEGGIAGDRNAQILLSDNSINDISKPISIGDNIVELTINGTAKKGKTDTSNRPIKWWVAA